MHSSVLAAWHSFSEPLEGRVHWMYCDILGLITVGVGNLIDGSRGQGDPVAPALRLPWKHPDGRLATDTEIRAQWNAVKAHADRLKIRHYKFAEGFTTIRLTNADIDALVVGKLLEFEVYLRKHHFPFFDQWPADAQLGALSMAWALGPGYPSTFKNFKRYANEGDWLAAKACCKIRTAGNPGVVPRNRHNELCFDNAATVVGRKLDVAVLHWPNEAPIGLIEEPPPTKTEPPVITDADRAQVEAIQAEYTRTLTEKLRVDGMRELSGLESLPPNDAEEGGPDAA